MQQNNDESKPEGAPAQSGDYVQNLLISIMNPSALGQSPMEQLELKYNKDDTKDIDQLRDILSKNLSYPSTQIAEIHLRANRLGTLDLRSGSVQQSQQMIDENAKFCPCCGFIQQLNTLTIRTNIKHVTHIGVSTFFYFFTLVHLVILMVIMLAIFSGYAIVTNIQASNMYKNSLNGSDVLDIGETYSGFLMASLGSKAVYYTQFGNSAFSVQCWLGVVFVVIWGFIFVVIEYREREAEHKVDYESKTAGDYTLVFENMPKDMSKEELEKQLNEYLKVIRESYSSHLLQKDIKISKVNQAIPFYLDESTFDNKQLDQINKQHDKCKQTFVKWIKKRQQSLQFPVSQQQRQQIYTQFNNLSDRKIQVLKNLTDQVIEKKKQNKRFIETVPTFVTFSSSYNKELLQKLHDGQNYRFLYKLPCFHRREYYRYNLSQGGRQRLALIKTAPEPEDIIWTNLGQSQCSMFLKKLLSFGVSIVVLCLSFVFIYYLSSIQYQLSANNQANKNTLTLLSILISLSLTVINMILNKILTFFTTLQRNQTFTQQQTSLGLKAVIVVLINSIVVPIIVSRFFKFNLYGVNGLSQDIFYFAITNSFVTPLMKIFDLYYFFTRIMKWYYYRPNSKLSLDQSQLNAKSQYVQFSVGSQYIYIVNTFLFTCFFVSLQPLIPIVSIIGLLLMYYAQRYSLYNRCKRPTPGNSIVNSAMYQLIYMGPLLYSIGSLCWSNFLSNMQSGQTPNIVALVISFIIFVIPYRQIVKGIRKESVQPEQIFEKNRIFLPSQYDRLNPTTSKEGIQDYMDLVADYQKNLKNKTPEQLKALQNIFVNQYGVSHRHNQDLFPTIGKLFSHGRFNNNIQNQNLFKQLLGGTNTNSMNPLLIGKAVMDNNKSGTNSAMKKLPVYMAVQNWLTHEETARNSYGYNKNKNNNNNNKHHNNNNKNNNNTNPLAIIAANIKNTPQFNNANNANNANNQNFQSSDQQISGLAQNLYGGLFHQNMGRNRGRRNYGGRNRRRGQRNY